ncbi:MAG: UDP-3-O-(3-hydroxymyristoyl)glucosamine N-acyltransferase [Candidatus Cloacimonetes bacterium]|nr:UDP-3-O-(3-hydroxymyristoyl)glucosamine N-acyltransferase [Candidatus Cloacimonadota bacterium]
MKKFNLSLSLEQIKSKSGAELVLRNNVTLNNVAELSEANRNSICFFENAKYLDELKNSKAGLIFVPLDFDITQNEKVNFALIEKPYFKFMELVQIWIALGKKEVNTIAETAFIAQSAEVGENVSLGTGVVIEENVNIGSNTVIEANCVIKNETNIGENCHLYPNVTIYDDTKIGNNVVLHTGCVIGADGFGYFFQDNKQIKIPQVGNVTISDFVEIGANTTIDRATIGSTSIGEGTKLDNLVQIGHNCKIGRDTIICAQVGLAGNTEIGDLVFVAGQVGAAGHLKIGDRAMIGAQAGVSKSVPEGAKYFGTPATDARLQKRMMISQKKLPDFFKEWKEFKKKDR